MVPHILAGQDRREPECGRAMLRAERLENRDAFWLTNRKIANRIIYEVAVARILRGCPFELR